MARAVPIHKLTRVDSPLRASAPVLLVRLQELLDYADAVHDPQRVTELHDMRIAAKRLRYTLEIFASTLGPEAPPLLKVVEEIQERLGDIHDCDVLFPLLMQTLEREIGMGRRRTARDGPPPYLAAEGLAPLMGRKRAERERLYAEFIAFWDALPPERFAERLANLVSGQDTIVGELETPGAPGTKS